MNASTALSSVVCSVSRSISRAASTAVSAIFVPFVVRKPVKSGCVIVSDTPRG